MLVLTRKPGESIMIGDDVVVTILEIRGGQIRLGVQAPRETEVHRSEPEGRSAGASIDADHTPAGVWDTLPAPELTQTAD